MDSCILNAHQRPCCVITPALPTSPHTAQMLLWGWRLPFLITVVTAPIALLLRMHMVRCARLCWCSSPAACDLFPWCNDIQCSMDCSKTPT